MNQVDLIPYSYKSQRYSRQASKPPSNTVVTDAHFFSGVGHKRYHLLQNPFCWPLIMSMSKSVQHGMDLGIFSENAALYFRKVQTQDRVLLKIAKQMLNSEANRYNVFHVFIKKNFVWHPAMASPHLEKDQFYFDIQVFFMSRRCIKQACLM